MGLGVGWGPSFGWPLRQGWQSRPTGLEGGRDHERVEAAARSAREGQ